MLGRWKDKVNDFFTKETSEGSEKAANPNQSPNQNREIKTKMMYQYPTKSRCRFPLIPDNTEEIVRSDTPAYQRRANDHNSQEERPVVPKENVTKKKQPFVPSPIISPIYGYQKRKEIKEVENVPSYVRRQREAIKEKVVQQTEINIPDKVAQSTKEEEEVEIQIKEEHFDLPNEKKEDQQEIKTKQSVKIHKDHKNKSRRRNHKDHIEEKHSPFNVIMTPRDKKSLFEKRKMQRESPKIDYKPINRVQQKHVAFPYYLLNDPVLKSSEDKLWVKDQQELLERTLKHFKVRAKVVNATQGPSVTRFEVQPELGVKVSSVRNLNDDIKLNMSARDIRIEAPIPGKNTIGIEIPNLKAQMVGLQEIFESEPFRDSKSPLTIGLGLTVEGLPLVTNISKMPHGLIAGATGSGKSVCINTILISLLYKASHNDVKFLLIDPKMVELAPYNGIPHLVAPVITDVKAATAALKWAVSEMEERYVKFVKEGARDIDRYNEKMVKQNRPDEKMPFMVIVIDELADLMMAAPHDVEEAICRIAQKARACGMHLLLATQRPSVDVITGLIKANIPTRIAFSVSSQVDSRTIIDTNGADRLLGKGDMLFVENGSGKSIRLQGAFVSDEEIERVTNHARSIAEPEYLFEQEQLLRQIATEEDEDELLEEVIQFVLKQNSASTSLLQRQFRIGYNRAARLIDTIENKGIISGQNGSKPRDVLLSEAQLVEMYD